MVPMGPSSETPVVSSSAAPEFASPEETQSASPTDPSASRPQLSQADRAEWVDSPERSSGGVPGDNLRLADWLYRSHSASVIWLVVRLWLGYQWFTAGYQKIWGSEKAAFWFGGGAGVKGFAAAGVAGSATGKSGASYGWWAGFLHNVVIPNASWIGKFISLSEILIGIALILGLFTGAAALTGLSLNIIYMFTGSAGVNPAYAILSVLLVLAWRNAGWFGLDRFILNDDLTQPRLRAEFGRGLRHNPRVPLATTPH